MKRSIVMTALLLSMLMWTFSAEAQCWVPGGGGRGPGPGWQAEMAGINVSQEQTNKLNNLHQEFIRETAPLNTKIMQKQLEMKSLLLEPNTDAQKVTKLNKEISELQLQFSDKRLSYQLAARKILTPEQIAQLPPGCTLGFGNMLGGPGPGYGCGMGPGHGGGKAMGKGCGMASGAGRGCSWW